MSINNPSESNDYFEDSIMLDTEMTRDQAIRDLALFHDTNEEAVLASFLNLRSIHCEKILFEKTYSGQGGFEYILMTGINKNGRKIWTSMINGISGNPIAKVA